MDQLCTKELLFTRTQSNPQPLDQGRLSCDLIRFADVVVIPHQRNQETDFGVKEATSQGQKLETRPSQNISFLCEIQHDAVLPDCTAYPNV